MKKRYVTPKSENIELINESVLCLSYGGNGDGRPAYSDRQDINGWTDAWTDVEDDAENPYEF